MNEIYLPNVLEKLLTCRRHQVISPGFSHSQVNDWREDAMLDQMVREIAIALFETRTENPKSTLTHISFTCVIIKELSVPKRRCFSLELSREATRGEIPDSRTK